MRITRLVVRNFRRFAEIEMMPIAGMNLISGDNGAGKTSLLEAIHLMAYGRSFRGRVRDGLIRNKESSLEVFIEWQHRIEGTGENDTYRLRKAGLKHSGPHWEGRLDGHSITYLGDICSAIAVVSFEPGSHLLISGGGELRRRFVDWGLFHVEPDFLSTWRRYGRALKQRNALLKAGGTSDQLDIWDKELANTGESLARFRNRYIDRLAPNMIRLGKILAPELGVEGVKYLAGWKREELTLTDALLLSRERDRAIGYTSIGPHRSDWRLIFDELPGREALSRGQEKIAALISVLAQAESFSAHVAQWPVILLDDLPSELDRIHQIRVLEYLRRVPAQLFVTATELPPAVVEIINDYGVFHVEHDGLTREVIAR